MTLPDAWNPQQYDRFRDERTRPFFDLLAMVRPVSAARVVDLGCGTGELTRELHRTLGAIETIGIDSSAAMLAKTGANTEAGLRFERGDIATWTSEKPFNVIFSNAAIQWVPDHPALFRRLRDMLSTGGQLAIQMPANDDHVSHESARVAARRSPFKGALNGWTRPTAVLQPEVYAQLLFDLAFLEQQVQLNVYPHVLAEREAMIEWVRGTMLTDYQRRLPAELWEAFLGAYRDELFSRVEDRRPLFYPFKRILMWARK